MQDSHVTDERMGLPSASSIHRLAACPGSWRLEKGQPDTSSAESESGTRIHGYLSNQVPVEHLSAAEESIAIDCIAMADRMVKRWLEYLSSLGPVDYTACQPQEVREQRLWLEINGKKVLSGQMDDLRLLTRHGLIMDYKTGRGETQDPSENLQLRTLAILVAKEFRLETVAVAIIQPLAAKEPSLCPYDVGALFMAQACVEQILSDAQNPDAPLIPGDRQCKYCKAALVCPARKQQVEQLAVTTIHETGLTVSNQELVGLLEKCGPAAKMIASIKAEAFRRAEQDPEAWRELGFEIVTPKGKSEISDLPAVSEKLNALGVPWADISARCKMPKGAVKDLLRPVAKAQGLTLKDAEWSVLKDNCTQKPGKPKLARIGAGDDEEEE